MSAIGITCIDRDVGDRHITVVDEPARIVQAQRPIIAAGTLAQCGEEQPLELTLGESEFASDLPDCERLRKMMFHEQHGSTKPVVGYLSDCWRSPLRVVALALWLEQKNVTPLLRR